MALARPLCVCSLLLTAGAAWGASAAPPRLEEPAGRPDIALTLSGGVSLGAYEAGLTWTMVRFLRHARAHPEQHGGFRPQLVGVTGASAGSINALLAGAFWCLADDASADDSVDANLLRDTWLPVGLDALLPEDPRAYRPDDGILARAPLEATLQRLRTELFGPGGARRFRPGCQVPVGLSLTRLAPEVRHIAGLPALTQRFLVPLRLEVTPAGRLRVRPQPLRPDADSNPAALLLPEAPDAEAPGHAVPPEAALQALLASGAFPLAFSPREVCDCSEACPAAQRVRAGSCPGPFGQPLGPLACAPAAPGRPERVLCRRPYIDGGVFDNAPVGLAIDLVEATRPPALFNPAFYVFVDPDVRRLEAQGARHQLEAAPERSAQPVLGLGASLSVFEGLVSTARNSELGRAARARDWNRTTQTLLREAAWTGWQYAQAHAALAALGDGRPQDVAATDVDPPPAPASPAAHVRRARSLLSCVRRLSVDGESPRARALASACAAAVRGAAWELALTQDPLASDPEQAALATTRLSADEAVSLAAGLHLMLEPRSSFRRGVDRALLDPSTPPAARLRVRAAFRDNVELLTGCVEHLATELDSLARLELSDAQQYQLRAAVLSVLRMGRELGATTHALATAVVDGELAGLEAAGLAPLSELAAEARGPLASLPPGQPFDVASVERVYGAALEALLDPALAEQQRARAEPGASERELVAHHTRVLGTTLALAPRLQRIAVEAATVAETAAALLEGQAPERRLMLSTRFAPLAGSQLANFAGFLDEPLRELDYYAGVYDATRTLAASACLARDPLDPRMPVPVLLPGPDAALDVRDVATQRCLGALMGYIAERLDLLLSQRARHVLVALAREELRAALGSTLEAEALLAEPVWAWAAREAPLQPQDPLAAALAAVRSHRRPCGPADSQRLCLAEPTFEEFLEGLREAGYRPRERSMRLALEDTERWWGATFRRVVDRATAVELSPASEPDVTQEDAAETASGVRLALGAGQLWSRRGPQAGVTPRLELDTSSLPAQAPPGTSTWGLRAMHAVPTRITFDVASGGVALAWLEPALRLSPRLSLLSQLEPLDYEGDRERMSSTAGLRPTLHLGSVSLGAGPRLSLHWGGERRWDAGATVHLGFLQDRLGLTVGIRAAPVRRGESIRSDVLVALSLADLNGLVYWLSL